MKKFIHLFLILVILSSCERKSGSGNFKHNQNAVDKSIKQTKEVELNHDFEGKESPYNYHIEVISITDGDTFIGLTKEEKIKIKYRIYGIDAPEKKQDFGARSKDYLSELIAGKTVGIKTNSQDRYGRYIVWVFTPDGRDVSVEMLKAGMAWHYKEYDNSKLYEALEIQARKRHTGLWINNEPVAPWDFRKK
jgi:micrococcal nuclease